MSRKKLSLVIGELYNSDMAFALAGLASSFEVTAYVIQRIGSNEKLPFHFRVEAFPCVVDTPGYMRGVEASILSSDVIVCMNFGSLSSLQAARVAKENKIPLVVYSSQVNLAVFEGFKNILNIQDFVMSQASHYIVPVGRASDELIKKGVAASQISTLLPVADPKEYSFSHQRRERFRSHIGIDIRASVLLYHGEMIQNLQPDLILRAIKVLTMQNKMAEKHCSPKVIFAGDGPFAKRTQYLAYELGLGENSYFLAQDTEPFLQDLYCSSDLLICPSAIEADELALFPYKLFKATACGMLPLTDDQSLEHSLFPINGLTWRAQSWESLASLLSEVLVSPESFEEGRKKLAELIAKLEKRQCLQPIVEKLLELTEAPRQSGSRERPSLDEDFWHSLEEACEFEETAEGALSRVVELDLGLIGPKNGARAHYLRGVALTTLKRFDCAGDAFDSSLLLNPQFWQAHYGAGYLAWQSYSHEEAMKNFKKGLALAPNNHRCLMGVALVYKRLGMAEDAIYWTEKAISMGAKGHVPFRILAQACSESKRVDFAIATLEKVLEHTGEEGVLLGCLGQLYLKAGYTKIGHQMLDKYLGSKAG